MTVRAEKEVKWKKVVLLTNWSGINGQNGSHHSAFLCSCFAPSFFLIFLPNFQGLEGYTVMTATYWTLSGTKACGEVSTFPSLARDTRSVIHFWNLPEGKYKYPSLTLEANPRCTRCFFMILQIIIFFALTSSVPFSQWQSHDDILPQKPFLFLVSVCSLKVVLFWMTRSFKVQGHN